MQLTRRSEPRSADLYRRMPTYADVCRRMVTIYAANSSERTSRWKWKAVGGGGGRGAGGGVHICIYVYYNVIMSYIIILYISD